MFERNNQDLRYHEREPQKKKLPPHRAPGDFEAPETMEPGAVAVSGIAAPLEDASKSPATDDHKEQQHYRGAVSGSNTENAREMNAAEVVQGKKGMGTPGSTPRDTSSYQTSFNETKNEKR